MDNKQETKIPVNYKITIDLPAKFYLQLRDINNDFLKKGKKIYNRDIVMEALNLYFKEHGYAEIK
jgi:hypothetical protein